MKPNILGGPIGDDVDLMRDVYMTREQRGAYERLRKDAERYRWLRGLDGSCDSAACVNFNIGFDWIEAHGVELDEAIDAAMQGANT